MSNDIIIDLDSFDFNSLDDSDISGNIAPAKRAEPEEEIYEDDSFNLDEIDDEYADEDSEEDSDEDEDEGGTAEDDFNTVKDFAEKFDDIPDDLEFKIGDGVFTKNDIRETISKRAELSESYQEMSVYVQNIQASESAIADAMNLSMSEAQTRLIALNQALSKPEELDPRDVQRYLTAKRDTEARYNELQDNVAKVRKAEDERKQEISVMRIKQTDVAMRGTDGWKGIPSIGEYTKFAESKGLNSDLVLSGMSPGLITILMNAKKYEDLTAKNKGRIKASVKGTAPRSVASKAPSRNSTSPKSASKASRQAALQKMSRGKLDSKEFFDNLID